jgi:hypothetical protein
MARLTTADPVFHPKFVFKGEVKRFTRWLAGRLFFAVINDSCRKRISNDPPGSSSIRRFYSHSLTLVIRGPITEDRAEQETCPVGSPAMRRSCASFHNPGGHPRVSSKYKQPLRPVSLILSIDHEAMDEKDVGAITRKSETTRVNCFGGKESSRVERFLLILAARKKEMGIKNTAPAAGNNFLLARGTTDSALVTGRLLEPYLAINWQRAEIQSRLPLGDRRFPTPVEIARSLVLRRNEARIASPLEPENGRAVTTSHVFSPNERRRAALLLPIWRPNPDFLGSSMAKEPKGGAGGVSQAKRPKAVDRKAHTEFLCH